MFKEKLSNLKEKNINLGCGILYDESCNKMKGEFFITLKDKNGTEEHFHYPNIIVNSASLLISRLLADGQTSVDPSGPAHGIWVLAVGTGNASWDKLNPPAPVVTDYNMESELARKRFSSVNFVRTDGSGLPSSTVTNILDFQTIFNESEAVGPLMELGLFGGDASETIADTGTMINKRNIAVISKTNTMTMSIIFRLTT